MSFVTMSTPDVLPMGKNLLLPWSRVAITRLVRDCRRCGHWQLDYRAGDFPNALVMRDVLSRIESEHRFSDCAPSVMEQGTYA